jgi:hypothetical protein
MAAICAKIADSAVHARLLTRKIVFNGRRRCTGLLPAPRFRLSRAFDTLCRFWNSLHDDKDDSISNPWAQDCPRPSALIAGSSRLRAKRTGEGATGAINRCASSDRARLARTGTNRSREDACGRHRHHAAELGYGRCRA